MADYTDRLVAALDQAIHPLRGSEQDYDPLLALVGDARLVLLGEASHGTHEFYDARAHITRRLIEEKGFTIVAVEADWPDAYRVNRWVRGQREDGDAASALGDFKRFPTWMWRNNDVRDFVRWLHEYNSGRESTAQAGFYGLDLYSLYRSMEAVLAYLDEVDPEAAKRARYRYSCFEHFGEDSQAYGYAATYGMTEPCEDEVVAQLIELRQMAHEAMQRNGLDGDELFYAEQNARLVKNAEEYYRSMFKGHVTSWNLRDRHMFETLTALLDHHGPEAKAVVWEHNSHLGDARATEMGQRGEWNVGQLVRQEYEEAAILVGFSTHTGTVTAASNWDEPAQRKRVRPSHPDSYENLFHRVQEDNFFLPLRGQEIAQPLTKPRLERAIGVIYRPETERLSHYFFASLPRQFDAIIHFEESHAVEPLERNAEWETIQEGVPETYPFGL